MDSCPHCGAKEKHLQKTSEGMRCGHCFTAWNVEETASDRVWAGMDMRRIDRNLNEEAPLWEKEIPSFNAPPPHFGPCRISSPAAVDGQGNIAFPPKGGDPVRIHSQGVGWGAEGLEKIIKELDALPSRLQSLEDQRIQEIEEAIGRQAHPYGEGLEAEIEAHCVPTTSYKCLPIESFGRLEAGKGDESLEAHDSKEALSPGRRSADGASPRYESIAFNLLRPARR